MYSEPVQQPVLPKPNYLALTKNNKATSQIIDSLGGIQNTIEPMHASMTNHELRPFEYVHNYKQELHQMQQNPSMPLSYSKGHVRSVSPYRAAVYMQEDSVDLERELPDISPLDYFKNSRQSPIKDDSIVLREKGGELLQSF